MNLLQLRIHTFVAVMQRYFLELSYCGSNYNGWQIQQNAQSIQEVLQHSLKTLTGAAIEVTGCGRTDTGVHAKQFFAHFDLDETVNDSFKYLHQLNGLLPHDITAHQLYPVHETAHARYDAIQRTYEYYAFRKKNSFLRPFAAPFYFDLDIEKINSACRILGDYSDFKCFAKNRSDVKHTLCTISEASWKFNEGFHYFKISANRFLRGMVRSLVGTLVQVGRNEINHDDFRKIIENKERSEAGPAVAAAGLYLSQIEYPYLKSNRKLNFPFVVTETGLPG